ncbi:hypothetical protein V8G54_035644, partial [Vigna mungo]
MNPPIKRKKENAAPIFIHSSSQRQKRFFFETQRNEVAAGPLSLHRSANTLKRKGKKKHELVNSSKIQYQCATHFFFTIQNCSSASGCSKALISPPRTLLQL